MPLFEYVCPACGNKFSELVRSHEEKVSCPACGAEAKRNWSGCMYSATGKPPKKCSGKCSECSGCR